MTDSASLAVSLSTEQFLQAAKAADIHTAVFDFDGTLWPGDAGSGFLDWSIETALLSPSAAQHILHRHSEYHRGQVDEIAICGEMTQIYRGLSEVDVRKSAARYFQRHVQPHFYPAMVSLVHDMQRRGVEVWAVSSTNHWMIEEGVRQLHIEPSHVLAAKVLVENDLITDTLVHVPSDEGKAEALRVAGLPHPDAVFGNSVHDLAMLRMARLPFPVNPSAELAARSAELGWPVYYPVPAASLL